MYANSFLQKLHVVSWVLDHPHLRFTKFELEVPRPERLQFPRNIALRVLVDEISYPESLDCAASVPACGLQQPAKPPGVVPHEEITIELCLPEKRQELLAEDPACSRDARLVVIADSGGTLTFEEPWLSFDGHSTDSGPDLWWQVEESERLS